MERPSILIPYSGASSSTHTQDVFICMRPETNGVVGEKVVMNILHCCPEYAKKEIKLVYLANIPSDVLVSRNIYKHYYALKIHFAARGGELFTPVMRRACSEYFNTEFDPQRFIGSFAALKLFSLRAEKLFALRVNARDMLTINGQSIKRYRDYFVVNYDVPALIHRYSLNYNIALMCVRIKTSYAYFKSLVEKMHAGLVAEGLVRPGSLLGSTFHYSRGPFDQLRDGMSFLLDQQGDPIDLEQISFAHYLLQRGVSRELLQHLSVNPIVTLTDDAGSEREVSITDYTQGREYAEAYRTLTSVMAYSCIDPLGLIKFRATSVTPPKVAKISATI